MRRDQSKTDDDLTSLFSLSPVAVKTETRGLGASLLCFSVPNQLCAGNQSMMGRSMRARVCVSKWMWKETSFQKRPACYNLGFCFFKCPCMFSAFSNLTREVPLYVFFIPGWHMFFHSLCFVFFRSTTSRSIIPTRCGGLECC